MNLELSPLFVHIALFVVNIYFEFQVYMFSNGRDMTKGHSFLHEDDAKAIAISWVFSENSRAKTAAHLLQSFLPFPKQISIVQSHLYCPLQCPIKFGLVKMLLFGKG